AEGPRRFARWDADLFEAVVAGPAAALRQALDGQADIGPTLAAYLRLAHQGIGIGSLRRARAEAGGWASFLERCLVELVPAFLPGAMALAGPTLLQVADRRQPGPHAAVLLRAGGRSELLGLMSGLGDYPEPEGHPAVEFWDGRVTVGGQVVEVPLLRDCHRHA